MSRRHPLRGMVAMPFANHYKSLPPGGRGTTVVVEGACVLPFVNRGRLRRHLIRLAYARHLPLRGRQGLVAPPHLRWAGKGLDAYHLRNLHPFVGAIIDRPFVNCGLRAINDRPYGWEVRLCHRFGVGVGEGLPLPPCDKSRIVDDGPSRTPVPTRMGALPFVSRGRCPLRRVPRHLSRGERQG